MIPFCLPYRWFMFHGIMLHKLSETLFNYQHYLHSYPWPYLRLSNYPQPMQASGSYHLPTYKNLTLSWTPLTSKTGREISLCLPWLMELSTGLKRRKRLFWGAGYSEGYQRTPTIGGRYCLNQRDPATYTITPEYMFLNQHLFGVSYQAQIPIMKNVC